MSTIDGVLVHLCYKRSTFSSTIRNSRPNKKNRRLHAHLHTETRARCSWTPSPITPSLPLHPSFSSHDTNACSSCADPWVMNPSQREDIFILSQDAHPTSQILICLSGDGSDAHRLIGLHAYSSVSHQSSSGSLAAVSYLRVGLLFTDTIS